MCHEQEEISCDLALLHVAEMEKIAALFRHETCKMAWHRTRRIMTVRR
jgi:uncharacterized small protein (DUF1192 family)